MDLRRALEQTETANNSNMLTQMEFCFTGFYVVEMALRFRVYGVFILRGWEWKWNIMDIFLVTLAFGDSLLQIIYSGDEAGTANFSFVRLLRILRLTRALRIFRAVR